MKNRLTHMAQDQPKPKIQLNWIIWEMTQTHSQVSKVRISNYGNNYSMRDLKNSTDKTTECLKTRLKPPAQVSLNKLGIWWRLIWMRTMKMSDNLSRRTLSLRRTINHCLKRSLNLILLLLVPVLRESETKLWRRLTN